MWKLAMLIVTQFHCRFVFGIFKLLYYVCVCVFVLGRVSQLGNGVGATSFTILIDFFLRVLINELHGWWWFHLHLIETLIKALRIGNCFFHTSWASCLWSCKKCRVHQYYCNKLQQVSRFSFMNEIQSLHTTV